MFPKKSHNIRIVATMSPTNTMERRLYDASREGNTTELLNLLEEDPLALERSCFLGSYVETPLHIAAMLGHIELAKEILNRKPGLAAEGDLLKSTPLHLAAAANNVEMVTLLLNTNPDVCFAFDGYGRNPLHVAAIKGRIDVLKRLIRVKRGAARMPTDKGDSILHLCVKYKQVEALKVLVDEMRDDAFVNSVDYNGNTVLHLAVLDKQFEAVNFLVQSPYRPNVNAENFKGQTALDVLYMKSEGGPIGQALVQAGATSSTSVHSCSCLPLPVPGSQADKASEVDHLLSNVRKPGMVVASVIAAAAFQAGMNPPGGVWQDTSGTHKAGRSVLADEDPVQYNAFVFFNTLAFLASITIFVMLLANLPFTKHRFLTSALMTLAVSAVIFFPLSYSTAVVAISPPHHLSSQLHVAVGVMSLIWSLIFASLPLSRKLF